MNSSHSDDFCKSVSAGDIRSFPAKIAAGRMHMQFLQACFDSWDIA